MQAPVRRPRKAAAIYSAAFDLLVERGYEATTIEAIAVRAGVHKTTIYRSWRSKDDVLAAALTHVPQLSLRIPDTGTLRGDLTATARRIAALLAEPATQRIITAVLAALPDRPSTAAATVAFFADRLDREQVMFHRARERGELPADADPATIMNLVAGGLWLQILARGEPADDAYCAGLVEAILNGVTTRR